MNRSAFSENIGQRLSLLGFSQREFWLLNIVGIGIVLAIVLFFFRPAEQRIAQPDFKTSETHSGTVDVSFTGTLSLPPEMFYVHATKFFDQSQLLAYYGNFLQLNQNELSPDLYTNSDLSQSLVLFPDNQGVQYSNQNNAPADESYISPEITQQYAEEFLQKLGFRKDDLSLDTQNYYIAETEELNTETTAEKATFHQLIYSIKMHGYKVAYEASVVDNFVIQVSPKGVFSAIFSGTIFEAGQQTPVKTLSLDVMLENIRQGKFTIVGTSLKYSDEVITNLRLTQAEIQYRYSSQQSHFIPMVIFDGEAIITTATGPTTIPISIMTPVIATQPVQ